MSEVRQESQHDPATHSPSLPKFEIAQGGPFVDLQEKLGIRPKNDPYRGSFRRALIFVAIAWGVPLLLSVAAGTAWGPAAQRPYLLDPGAYARFLIGIGVFIAMERMVEERLLSLVHQFARTPLLGQTSIERARAAVAEALKRRDAPLPEALIALFAIGMSLLTASTIGSAAIDTPVWALAMGDEGEASIRAAGWFVLLVSGPIYWFLFIRWLWRHLIWALMLRKIARLDLRLTVTHPDGSGGIAFISEYPNAFTAFVFALSCAVAAPFSHALAVETMGIERYPLVMTVWLAIVFFFFALPLMAFTRPLAMLKKETMLAATAAATNHQRKAEKALFGHTIVAQGGDEPDGPPGGDPAKTYAAAVKLATLPVTRSALLPLGSAALAPLVAAGLTRFPFQEIFKIAKGILL